MPSEAIYGKNFFKVFHPKVWEVCTMAYILSYTPKLMYHSIIKDNAYYKTNNAKVKKMSYKARPNIIGAHN